MNYNTYRQAEQATEAERRALEALRKSASDPTLTVGDYVFCRGAYALVTEINRLAPGAHAASPIRNDWTAIQVVTDMGGSRWHGVEPESAPQSGYTPCACRDCMDTTVSSDTSKPELCSPCADAGCTEGQSESDAYDCLRDDAYDDNVSDAGMGHGAYEYRSGN